MGWGVGLSAILGGALGYWAGRTAAPSNDGFGGGGISPYYMASMMANNHYGAGAATTAIEATQSCRTCYQ